MNKKNEILSIKIPKKPKEFICEEVQLIMTEQNIKDFAKDYNFTYVLDYINAKVRFMDKNENNN